MEMEAKFRKHKEELLPNNRLLGDTSNGNYAKKLFIRCLFLLPVILYFIFLWKLSENIPYLDDYGSILGFVSTYLKTDNLAERVQLIFSQHNDHRIVFQRLVVLAQYYLFGSINFVHLIYLGNLSIIGILIILLKSVTRTDDRLYLMLPAVYLLFCFRYFEASLWAMVTLSGLWVVTFSLASLWLLSRNGNQSLIGSCIFATLAMYSQGNGKLVLVSGLVLLILTRDHNRLISWVGFSGALCLSTLLFNSTYGGYPTILSVLNAPFNHFFSVFSFLGLFVAELKLSIILGGIIILAFLHCCWMKYYERNLVMFMMFFHVILTAVAVGYSRSYVNFASRYSIYSILALIFIYLIYIDMFSHWLNKICFLNIVGVFIVCFILGNYLIAPFYIELYKARIRHYEKNIILNYHAKIDRGPANQIYQKEFSEIIEVKKPFILPRQFISRFRTVIDKDNGSIMTDNHWWLTWIPLFSQYLITADSMRIYNINEMHNGEF